MKHDITIVGAGIAGLTAACALAQQTRLSIAIVDTKPLAPSWDVSAYHHRVSAIALSSKRIFQHLHAWQGMAVQRVSSFNRIAVWDESSQAAVTFNAAEVGESQLGYIIENNVMQDALLARLQQFPQVTVYAPVISQAIKVYDDRIELHTDKDMISSQLLIAADGANSWVRQQASIHLASEDYGHDAIVATVTTTQPHDKVARQVFLASGPLAFLPLDEPHTSSIVWSMPPVQAQAMLALTDDEFTAALTKAFSSRLGEVTHVTERFSFPLIKRRANRYIAQRIALVADAAHTVHPLAGQGLNVGLLDVASLVDVIVDAGRRHQEIGALTTLRRYERWRKGENSVMLSGIDAIKTLFCSHKQGAQRLRSFGLNVTQRMPMLKNMFTRHAIGSHEGLPTLARDGC